MDKEDEEKGEEEEAVLVRCSKAVGELGLGKERGGRDRRQSREAPTLANRSTSPNLPFNNIFLIPTINTINITIITTVSLIKTEKRQPSKATYRRTRQISLPT